MKTQEAIEILEATEPTDLIPPGYKMWVDEFGRCCPVVRIALDMGMACVLPDTRESLVPPGLNCSGISGDWFDRFYDEIGFFPKELAEVYDKQTGRIKGKEAVLAVLRSA